MFELVQCEIYRRLKLSYGIIVGAVQAKLKLQLLYVATLLSRATILAQLESIIQSVWLMPSMKFQRKAFKRFFSSGGICKSKKL